MADNYNNTIPNSIELEKIVLGCILNDSFVALQLCTLLTEEDFYTAVNKKIFKKLKEKTDKHEPCDFTIFSSSLSRTELDDLGGYKYLAEIASAFVSTITAEENARQLKKMAKLRQLIEFSSDVSSRAYNKEDAQDLIEIAQSKILAIGADIASKDLTSVEKLTDSVIDKISNTYLKGEEEVGLKVGFNNIDESVTNGGFKPGQMIVLAARPGCGKTSFAMNMVANIAREDRSKVIAVFNLEMSSDELIKRLLATFSNIDSKKISRSHDLNSSEYATILEAKENLKNTGIYIDDTASASMKDIYFKVSRLKVERGRIDLVVIDHLQLINERGTSSRYDKMTEISRNVKMLAKNLEVPVIALSQMSRDIEKRKNEDKKDVKPVMSDLKESGAIEQDADMIFFLAEGDFNLEAKPNYVPLELITAKNRSGETPTLSFGWHKDTMIFDPIYNPQKKYEDQSGHEDSNSSSNSHQNVVETIEDRYEEDEPVSGVAMDEPVAEIAPYEDEMVTPSNTGVNSRLLDDIKND